MEGTSRMGTAEEDDVIVILSSDSESESGQNATTSANKDGDSDIEVVYEGPVRRSTRINAAISQKTHGQKKNAEEKSKETRSASQSNKEKRKEGSNRSIPNPSPRKAQGKKQKDGAMSMEVAAFAINKKKRKKKKKNAADLPEGPSKSGVPRAAPAPLYVPAPSEAASPNSETASSPEFFARSPLVVQNDSPESLSAGLAISPEQPASSPETVPEREALTFSNQIIKITDSAYWLLLEKRIVVFAGVARVACYAGQPEIAGFRLQPNGQNHLIPSLDTESLLTIHCDGPAVDLVDFTSRCVKLFDPNSAPMRRVLDTLHKNADRVRAVLLVSSTNSVSDPELWRCVKLFPSIMPKLSEFEESVVELPRLVSTAKRQWLFPGCALVDFKSFGYIFANYRDQFFAQIAAELEAESSQRPVIVLCGTKNVGKSTSVRYIINRLLSRHQTVQCLDCDIGQSEFNPPGCISMQSISKPVFGAPFTRLREPDTCFYMGDVTVQRRTLGFYKDGLQYVFDQGRKSQLPLVVNTMGWIEDVGLDALKAVVDLVRPTLILELTMSEKPTLASDLARRARCRFAVTQTPVLQSTIKKQFNAAFRRNISVVSYLNRISPQLEPINSAVPYRVHLKDIFVSFIDTRIPNSHLFLTLLGSYVGIAIWDHSKTSIRELVEDIGNVRRVRQTPVARTVGFGVVTGIDPEKGELFILTPLKPRQVEACNLIIRGQVLTPTELFLGQDLSGYNGLLPRLQYRYMFEE